MKMKLPKFKSKIFLAPMAGISDPAFRTLCHEYGAGLTVTELTSVHALTHKDRSKYFIKEFKNYSEIDRPRAVQLFGNDISTITKAAKVVEPYFDMIDFNMGCPSPHITQQMAGAALLDKPEHVKEMLSALVDSVKKPVSLKLRAGINDTNKKLFIPIAKIAEECGIKMITLHARTLKQGYSGKADWSLIKELKSLVDISVVGNGDVTSPESAKRMFEETGCNYVMIGRAAMGNPLLFKQVNDYLKNGKYDAITPSMRISQFHKYLDYAKHYDINSAAIKIQAMQFAHGMPGAVKMRTKITSAKTVNEIRSAFD